VENVIPDVQKTVSLTRKLNEFLTKRQFLHPDDRYTRRQYKSTGLPLFDISLGELAGFVQFGTGWEESWRAEGGWIWLDQEPREEEMRKLRSRVDGKELKEKRIEDPRNDVKVETGSRQER
jgi:hypothetical protein